MWERGRYGWQNEKRWRMGEPKPTERPAETIQRKFRLPRTPVGALTPMAQQAGARQEPRGSQGRKEKPVGQRDEQEEFAARFPALQAQRFEAQFRFQKTELFLLFSNGERKRRQCSFTSPINPEQMSLSSSFSRAVVFKLGHFCPTVSNENNTR